MGNVKISEIADELGYDSKEIIQKAQEMGLKVICAGGKNIENIRAILDGKDYVGTTIG